MPLRLLVQRLEALLQHLVGDVLDDDARGLQDGEEAEVVLGEHVAHVRLGTRVLGDLVRVGVGVGVGVRVGVGVGVGVRVRVRVGVEVGVGVRVRVRVRVKG